MFIFCEQMLSSGFRIGVLLNTDPDPGFSITFKRKSSQFLFSVFKFFYLMYYFTKISFILQRRNTIRFVLIFYNSRLPDRDPGEPEICGSMRIRIRSWYGTLVTILEEMLPVSSCWIPELLLYIWAGVVYLNPGCIYELLLYTWAPVVHLSSCCTPELL